jgi:hypothetical protein
MSSAFCDGAGDRVGIVALRVVDDAGYVRQIGERTHGSQSGARFAVGEQGAVFDQPRACQDAPVSSTGDSSESIFAALPGARRRNDYEPMIVLMVP